MPILNSLPSMRACFLRFKNKTTRKTNVVWLDYNGRAVNYVTVEPNHYADIDAYDGHLWLSTDSTVGTRLLLNNASLFSPTPADIENVDPTLESRKRPSLRNPWGQQNINDELDQTTRQIVCITVPVLSLFQRSAEVINARLHNRKRYSYCDLPIPAKLKIALYKLQFVREYYIS